MSNTPTHGNRITYYNVIDTFIFFNRDLAYRLWRAFTELNDDEKEHYFHAEVLDKIQAKLHGRPPLYVISIFFEALLKERSEFKGDDRMSKRYSTAIFEKM